MFIKGTEISIVKGDITALKVEAIVNAANNELEMGGGVAGAIKRKGGKEIEEEALRKGPIKIGEAVATFAGKLPAKYVIHAATMGMPACRQAGNFKTDEFKIRESCKNSLLVAEQLKIKSLAFPALGCGVGGFPFLACAKIMSQEILTHLREGKSSLKEIIFCLYDEEAYQIFKKGALGYLEYVMQKLQAGPFITVDAIIEINEGIVIIERSNPPFGWALPGGFVDYGESLEEAVVREAREETGLDVSGVKQFHVYSAFGRDPRFHTIGAVFIAKAQGKPKAGDDAKDLRVIKLGEIDSIGFAFDHRTIIQDYIEYKAGKDPF
jgi:O-acetyl-ADP-ribose deacetylase (regulator of RNase III)/ADP-ribose pyrophosphatase YjhB (NUDIX family)